APGSRTAMLPHLVSDLASRYLPRLASGAAFHRRALDAAERGRWASAERWFERAAERYRRDLEVEALARLRVHQLMVRARWQQGAGGPAPADMVEIVQRLNRLDRLETLDSPHEMADARSVLAEWIEGQATPALPAPPTSSVNSQAA